MLPNGSDEILLVVELFSAEELFEDFFDIYLSGTVKTLPYLS